MGVTCVIAVLFAYSTNAVEVKQVQRKLIRAEEPPASPCCGDEKAAEEKKVEENKAKAEEKKEKKELKDEEKKEKKECKDEKCAEKKEEQKEKKEMRQTPKPRVLE